VRYPVRYDAESLYALLPAFHRIRDAEGREGISRAEPSSIEPNAGTRHRRGVLWDLVSAIAEQVSALEEDIDQLEDNAFIETCAEWVVPYLGDLIGYRPLHHVTPQRPTIRSARAEVGDTIGLRRRKGTAAMLEQLARDVSGWDASVVEFFLRLASTQYLNHLRPNEGGTADLRDMESLERCGTPFDSLPHSVDVRRIATARGRYNIPNVGIFLWRLGSFSWTAVRARPATPGETRRFLFHPLGINTPLFTLAQSETSISHLATPGNVPMRLSRRELRRRPAEYYGAEKSFVILRRITLPPGSAGPDLVEVPLGEIQSCNLADLDANPDTSTWPAGHPARVSVDPELGRIRTPADERELIVMFRYGFSAQIGGGEYPRLTTFAADPTTSSRYPGPSLTLESAIAAQANSGTIEINGAGPFHETPVIACAENAQLEIRSADHSRATFVLGGDLVIGGGDSSEVTLNGVLFSGGRIVVPATFNGQPNRLQSLRLVHCTVVPGIALHRDGRPVSPGAPSIVIECPDTELEVSWSITGPIRAVDTAGVRLEHSIIDANGVAEIAFAAPAPNDNDAGAPLSIESCTIIGKVHTTTMRLASNTLFASAIRAGDGWAAPVVAQRRQQGCVRFSFVPYNSIVPRRYRCHPATAEEALSIEPVFTSLRYGDPGYAQLAASTAPAVLRGADDGADVGAFHHLQQPQRVSDLRTRLDEYLRFGLEAGVFSAS
jgi:hypothetical protein